MNEALCRLLKQARLSNGLTQDDAGAMIYLSGNGYGKVERGQRDVTTGQLLTLCHGLGVPVSDMLASFGDSCVRAEFPVNYEGGSDMNENDNRTGLTVMDSAKMSMVRALSEHVDYVCLAAGHPYRDDMTPIDNLARIFVDVVMDGDRPVTSPVHALSDAIADLSVMYTISTDVQDEAAQMAITLSTYWDGRKELPLRQVVHNILWHTDFGSIDRCPAYAARVGSIRQGFHKDMDVSMAARRHDAARRTRISSALKPGTIVELYGDRDLDDHAYALITACTNHEHRVPSGMIVMLHATDGHTAFNTMLGAPYIEMRTNGSACPATLWADTSLVYSLAPEQIYDIVGEVDKPALDAVLDAIDNSMGGSSSKDNGLAYGSCIRYLCDGVERYGIVTYVDGKCEKVRLFDVLFLTDHEVSSCPGYIRLPRDTREPDGELFYGFDFPENVHPYLKRGGVTSFDCFHDSASDVSRIGSWPSKAYANDRIRDLGAMLNTSVE